MPKEQREYNAGRHLVELHETEMTAIIAIAYLVATDHELSRFARERAIKLADDLRERFQCAAPLVDCVPTLVPLAGDC